MINYTAIRFRVQNAHRNQNEILLLFKTALWLMKILVENFNNLRFVGPFPWSGFRHELFQKWQLL